MTLRRHSRRRLRRAAQVDTAFGTSPSTTAASSSLRRAARVRADAQVRPPVVAGRRRCICCTTSRPCGLSRRRPADRAAPYRTVPAPRRARLGAGDDSALLWLALVTMDAGQGPSVNLRAPIVVNPARMLGFQVMPHESLYPLRHPLALAE